VRSLLAMSLAACWFANANLAFADKELLQKNNCFACHSIDKRKYGPKLIEIAAKYSGEASAAQMLAKKIQAGGTGVWGEDIMPPQPQVSDAEALELANYILSLKK
jgi:cytochrome c